MKSFFKNLLLVKMAKFWFEFASILLAVLSAFALNSWNENRKDALAEHKILFEINQGLKKDLSDIEINIQGHLAGIRACQFWRSVVRDSAISEDSLMYHYFNLARDFVSLQNTSGYETLKSRGFELLKDDSIRTRLISLYEYDYVALFKFEEEYYEFQFYENYFHPMNDILARYYKFDENGNLTGMLTPLNLDWETRNKMLSYFYKIETSRKFVLFYYEGVRSRLNQLIDEFSDYLGSQ